MGPIDVNLHVSTTGTDSDFVVKLIDVYPGDFPNPPRPSGAQSGPDPANLVKMGGYQQLVRGEPFRGKFRGSFEKAEPFEPGKPAAISFRMPDVCHSFRKGHRVLVQVQSSWFPLVDRNPQTFVDVPNARPGGLPEGHPTRLPLEGHGLQRVLPGRDRTRPARCRIHGSDLPGFRNDARFTR